MVPGQVPDCARQRCRAQSPAGVIACASTGHDSPGSSAATQGGTAAAGAYTFQVNALDSKGNALTATTYAVVPVAGVTLNGANGPTVSLAGGLGSVTLNQIHEIY